TRAPDRSGGGGPRDAGRVGDSPHPGPPEVGPPPAPRPRGGGGGSSPVDAGQHRRAGRTCPRGSPPRDPTPPFRAGGHPPVPAERRHPASRPGAGPVPGAEFFRGVAGDRGDEEE